MAEAGEGGEDEIQFLRTVSLRGGGEAAGGGEERGAREEGLRCAAPRGRWPVPSPHSRCRGGPGSDPPGGEGLRARGAFPCLCLLPLPSALS